MQPGTGKLRLRNLPRTASANSREQNRLKTFHWGLNSTKTTPVYWGHPDPQRNQALGLEKEPGGRKSGAGGRKEQSKLLLCRGWLGTSSAAVIYYLHYWRSWENVRVSLSLAPALWAVLSLLLETAVYVLAELHRVEMWIFLAQTLLGNVFVAGGRDLSSGLSRTSLP